MMMDPRVLGLSLLALGLAGCGGETEEPLSEEQASDYAALVGEWRVVGHRAPGISALSEEQAEAWLGARLRINAARMALGESFCEGVSHDAESRPVAELLADYRLDGESLPPLAGREEIIRHRLGCDGEPWPSLGGTLLWLGNDRLLAPWEGVFFELERDDGFRAYGNEPFWNLAIDADGLRFADPFSGFDMRTPLPEAESLEQGGRAYHAQTEAHELRVEILPETCHDSMAGAPFETTVSVTLDGERFEGCGGAVPAF
ncbi:COG3650 family protein [Halomonas salifodinae]|uniref:COG3650 family protein n=1 Tax=Halomonas salifodinae TaxID=438745 RepID=A0ABW2ES96_9GAMM